MFNGVQNAYLKFFLKGFISSRLLHDLPYTQRTMDQTPNYSVYRPDTFFVNLNSSGYTVSGYNSSFVEIGKYMFGKKSFFGIKTKKTNFQK